MVLKTTASTISAMRAHLRTTIGTVLILKLSPLAFRSAPANSDTGVSSSGSTYHSDASNRHQPLHTCRCYPVKSVRPMLMQDFCRGHAHVARSELPRHL